jgi:hypothetical protein
VDRALWLLLRLRSWGWLRRLGRRMYSLKGAALAIVGLLVFVVWLLPAVLLTPPASAEHLELVRRFGPLVMFALCLLNVVTSAGEKAIYFSPAEVNFLFAGPFSRRQLLAYKLVFSFAICLLTCMFMALVFKMHASSFWAAYVGLVLTLLFLQLLTINLVLIGSMIGARAYNRRRQAVLFLLIVLATLSVFHLGRDVVSLSLPEMLQRAEETPAVQVVLTPFRWFIEVFTAARFWPDFLQPALLALAVNLCLLVLVFALDAQYLETAASASERIYATFQRMRSGGAGAAWQGHTGKPRFGLPALPWWDGIGPIAWRQLTAVPRNRGPLVALFILTACILAPVLIGLRNSQEASEMPYFIGGMAVWMTILLTPMITFDFRGDLDRMEVLKTLPIAPSRIVIGQLVAPVLVVSLLQWLILAAVAGILGRAGGLLGVATWVLPFNFLLFEIENLLFLWFPARLTPATAGDFQSMGRHMLIFFAKMLCLSLIGGVAAVAGVIIYHGLAFLGDVRWLLIITTVWLVLAAAAVGLVPLLVLAFRRFDVAQDTPP